MRLWACCESWEGRLGKMIGKGDWTENLFLEARMFRERKQKGESIAAPPRSRNDLIKIGSSNPSEFKSTRVSNSKVDRVDR